MIDDLFELIEKIFPMASKVVIEKSGDILEYTVHENRINASTGEYESITRNKKVTRYGVARKEKP